MGNNVAWLFYSGDWLKDPELSRCTKAERGVWIDCLAVLDGCPVRGVFCSADGTPWLDEEIARAIGGELTENLRCLSELLRKGVAHRNPKGAIYSRRMVRDSVRRESAKVRQSRKRHANVTPIVTPLSETENETEVVGIAFEVQGFDFESAFLALWKIYPKKQDSPLTRNLFIQAIEKVCKLHGFRRSEAAAYILSRTQIYVQKCKFIQNLGNYLENGTYEQDESMWEQHDPKKGKLDDAIKRAFSPDAV